MKTRLLLLVLAATISTVNSQNIDYAFVNVQYTRLPMKPLDKNVKNFQTQVSMEYLQKIEMQKAAHQKNLADAQANFAMQQQDYDAKLKTAALKYQMDMTTWNKLTPQQQAVTPKPEMPLIPQPVMQMVQEEPTEKTFNTELLASSYLNLEGFMRLPDNSVRIWVGLMGFENEAPQLTSKNVQDKKDGQTITVTKFMYHFNYRHQMKLKITLPNGTVVKDEFYSPSLSFRNFNTKEFNSAQEAEAYWITNKTMELQNAQDRIVTENLKQINEQLNDDHGFKKVNRGFNVIWVNEKAKYDDYREALTNAKNAYAIIGNPSSFQNATESLLKAIELWEKAMTESNPANKKARVDEDVTESTLLNLIEAYAWLNNFDKAQQYHSQLMTFKLSSKEKGFASAAQFFIQDQRKRAEANK